MSSLVEEHRRLWWYGGLAVVALGLLLAFFNANSLKTNAALERASEWERHTLEVALETRGLSSALQAVDTGERGYLLTGKQSYLPPYAEGLIDAPAELNTLKRLTMDNPRQQGVLGELSTLITQRLALAATVIAAVEAQGRSAAFDLSREDQENDLMASTRLKIAAVLAEEQRLLQVRHAISESATRAARNNNLIALALGLLLFGVTAGAFYVGIRADLKRRIAEATMLADRTMREREAEAERVGSLLKAIGEATPAMLYAKDRQGRLTYGNPSVFSVIGKPAAEAIGKTDVDWAPNPAQGEAITANDLRIMAGGTVETVDELFTDPNGVTRVFRSTKTPLRDASGAVIGLAGVTVDVSVETATLDALKESEERFRTLSNTLPAFIFVADVNGANTYSNRVFQTYTGKSSQELSGSGWLDTVHPEDRERAKAGWSGAWQTGKSYDAEYRFHHHADGYRVFIVRATPVRDAEGTVSQWVGTCIDTQELVSARKALEAASAKLELSVAERTADLQNALSNLRTVAAERQAAETQVRQMQKLESIGQLTGGIAHDFNNMLAIVIGSLDLAKRRIKSEPDRALKGIETAEEGARRAAQLTARLLAYSRQQALAPEVLNVNKLVGSMSELLRRTIGEGVLVETVLAGGLWNTLVDAAQLESSIVNLCVNARDAMPDGGKLTIETANAHLDDAYATQHPEATHGQYILIGVTDTGTGMPPEVIERAFDPFYTTKGVGKGTGLGLSQVYGFVKQSGGHVKIYSEPGQGTTVKIYLQRKLAEAALAVELKKSEEPPAANDGEILLVVEDEEAVRHMAVDVLRDLGYTVVQARDANQALEVLVVQPNISLLFTDIVMPNMNGRQLAEQALKMYPGLKVLFTTGYTRNAVVHNGILDAGVAFLQKPFSVYDLATKVRSVLDGGGSNRST